jgi:hypothetical protein
MAGRELPERIPEAVASHYRAPTLHDPHGAPPGGDGSEAREWAEAAVQTVKETVFPYHR